MPVIVKLPPIDFKVAPSENVTRFAAVIVQVLLAETIAGNDNVVNAAKDGATAPAIFASDVRVTVVADAHTGENPPPTVVKAGKLNVVNVAAVKPKAPTTVCKLVNVNDVKAAKVGLNDPFTDTRDGMLIVANEVPTGVNDAIKVTDALPIFTNAGKDSVVKLFAVNVQDPIMLIKFVNVTVVNAAAVPDIETLALEAKKVTKGKFIVVKEVACVNARDPTYVAEGNEKVVNELPLDNTTAPTC